MKNEQLLDRLVDRGWMAEDLRLSNELQEALPSAPQLREQVQQTVGIIELLRGGRHHVSDAEADNAAAEMEMMTQRLEASVQRLAEHDQHRMPQWWRGRTLLLAALVLLACSGWAMALLHQTPARVGAGAVADNRLITPAEEGSSTEAVTGASPKLTWDSSDAHRTEVLFAEVSQVFDGRAGWVAVTDKASELGLVYEGAKPTASDSLMLVRLEVLADGDRAGWANVAVMPGQVAEVQLVQASADAMPVRARVTPMHGAAPRLSIWLEVGRNDTPSQPPSILSTEAASAHGQMMQVGGITTKGRSYQLRVGMTSASNVSPDAM